MQNRKPARLAGADDSELLTPRIAPCSTPVPVGRGVRALSITPPERALFARFLSAVRISGIRYAKSTRRRCLDGIGRDCAQCLHLCTLLVSMNGLQKSDLVKSASRVLDVLEMFSLTLESLGVSEVARRLDVLRPGTEEVAGLNLGCPSSRCAKARTRMIGEAVAATGELRRQLSLGTAVPASAT